MQPEFAFLIGPLVIALALLLFPRQATALTWQPFRWLVEQTATHLDPLDVAELRRRLAARHPQLRTDGFWPERISASLMLMVLVGAFYWL